MKKVLLTITVFALLLVMALPVSAAAGKATVTSSGGVAPGDSITFTVTISNADPVLAAMIKPTFDASVFELVSGKFLQTGVMADFSGGDGVIAWAEPTKINGAILTFTLKAKDTATVGKTYTVGCNYTIRNADDESENGATAGSTVTILCKHSFTVKSTDSKYLASSASCTAKAKYYLSCAHCGAADKKTFEDGQLLQHDFSKKDMADKYAKVAGNCQTYGEYYFSCKSCGGKGDTTFTSDKLGDHVYDHGCDASCNLCGESRTVTHQYDKWDSDKENHWQACVNCGEKGQAQAHVPGPEATDTEPQICTVCQRELVPAKNHAHTYPDAWDHDETGHWHTCDCGSIDGLSVHSWGEKIVVKEATTEEEGILRTVCQICGAQRDDTIAKLPAPQQIIQTVTEKASNTPVIVLSIVLALSVVGNVVLVIALLKRKKK